MNEPTKEWNDGLVLAAVRELEDSTAAANLALGRLRGYLNVNRLAGEVPKAIDATNQEPVTG